MFVLIRIKKIFLKNCCDVITVIYANKSTILLMLLVAENVALLYSTPKCTI